MGERDTRVLSSGGSKILKRRVPVRVLAKNSEPRPFLCVTTPIFLLKTRSYTFVYGSFIVPDMMLWI